MTQILYGNIVAESVLNKVKEDVLNLPSKPKLVVILVGEDPASKVYVRNKEKKCEEVGILHQTIIYKENVSEDVILHEINKLNIDPTVSAILVQLPLPKHIDQEVILNAISPDKDVDCFNPYNVGNLMLGYSSVLPCTPAGIIEMLKFYHISLAGKKVLMIGRSNIVGKPTAMLLIRENATVTVAHSKTENLKELCRSSDVIIVAIGRAKYIKEDWVKPGAVIIDVGMDRDENGKLCGDVDFENVIKVASVSPVPKGVGPMTITMLMKQTVTLYKLQNDDR